MRTYRLRRLFFGVIAKCLAGSAVFAFSISSVRPAVVGVREESIDLSSAIIVSPEGAPGPERKAVQMLTEEVMKRTRRRWARETAWPTNDVPIVVVGSSASLQRLAKVRGVEITTRNAREGYRIWIERAPHRVVWIAGDDSRGVLFGAGRLLAAVGRRRGRI